MTTGVTTRPAALRETRMVSGESGPVATGAPSAGASSPLRSDVFVRRADPDAEAQQIATVLSELSLELRGVKLDETLGAKTFPLSQGEVTLAMPGQDPGAPLGVRRVDLRLHTGAYAVDFSVSSDGSLRIRNFYKDGESATVMLREALKRKISEDPILWGALTTLAATGVLYGANEYVRRTGDSVDFDLVNTTVMRHGPYSVRLKADAEVTGDDSILRGAGVGTTVIYDEGPLRTEFGVRYSREHDWEAEAKAFYSVNENVDIRAHARYRNDDYQVGIGLEARF